MSGCSPCSKLTSALLCSRPETLAAATGKALEFPLSDTPSFEDEAPVRWRLSSLVRRQAGTDVWTFQYS